MDGYKKSILRNSKGEVILPMTTTSMVSEESDRRFVDNIEKEVINKIATEESAVDELILNYQALSALASKELEILGLIDEVPNSLYDWGEMVNKLSVLEPFRDELIAGIGASPEVVSRESGNKYLIEVNDRDISNPFLHLVKVDSQALQPDNYTLGDEWAVPANALDVKIETPLGKITFNGDIEVVQSFDGGLLATELLKEQVDNIYNGVETKFQATGATSIPQLFINFDPTLSEIPILNVRRFELEVESSIKTKVQVYMDGDVVHPVRESTATYQKSSFSHLTWQTYIDDTFINKVSNNGKGYGIAVYGELGADISILRPKSKVYIENPYKGKTLIATKSQEGEFNILDWKVKE